MRKLFNYETVVSLKSESQFKKAYDRNGADQSKLNKKFIDEGRGSWSQSEIVSAARDGDKLSLDLLALQDEAQMLGYHAERFFGRKPYMVHGKVRRNPMPKRKRPSKGQRALAARRNPQGSKRRGKRPIGNRRDLYAFDADMKPVAAYSIPTRQRGQESPRKIKKYLQRVHSGERLTFAKVKGAPVKRNPPPTYIIRGKTAHGHYYYNGSNFARSRSDAEIFRTLSWAKKTAQRLAPRLPLAIESIGIIKT